MSFDEQPDDVRLKLAEVEAERDQQLEMSEQLARERVAEAAHRKRAEARAEQSERRLEEWNAWGKQQLGLGHGGQDHVSMRRDIEQQKWAHGKAMARPGRVDTEPTPLPDAIKRKAALYDEAQTALAGALSFDHKDTDEVVEACREYGAAAEEIPGEDHGMFLDDEMYHPLNEIVATLAGWWREGAAVDHELPGTTPLPEGARWGGEYLVTMEKGERFRYSAGKTHIVRERVACDGNWPAGAIPADIAAAVLSRTKDGA